MINLYILSVLRVIPQYAITAFTVDQLLNSSAPLILSSDCKGLLKVAQTALL